MAVTVTAGAVTVAADAENPDVLPLLVKGKPIQLAPGETVTR